MGLKAELLPLKTVLVLWGRNELGWGGRGGMSLFFKMVWNRRLSRVKEDMQSCGERREDGTFEENNPFF